MRYPKRLAIKKTPVSLVLVILIGSFFYGQTPTLLEVSESAGIAEISKFTDWYGNGASLADYDNDGDIDFFLATAFGESDRLYRNSGTGSFQDVSASVGLNSTRRSRTSLWFDYDGDHLLDLLVLGDCFNAADCSNEILLTLYRQDSDGQFTDVTEASGLYADGIYPDDEDVVVGGCAAGDINNDNFLDLIITTWKGKKLLFLNNGNGTFADIHESSNFGTEFKYHWQPVFYDFNGDGFLDIFCAIDFGPNELWINRGDNTFEEVAGQYHADNSFNEMGIALGDYDNDNDLDIYVTNITEEGKHNILLRNNTSKGILENFVEVAVSSGVAYSGWDWGTTFFDFDNDGWLDLTATNGMTEGSRLAKPSKLWLNKQDGTFLDIAEAANFGDRFYATSLMAFDKDRDGDIDLLQTLKENEGHGRPVRIYENQLNTMDSPRNYLTVKPRMNGSNHFAIGAVVKIEAGNIKAMRLISAGTSTYGQEAAEAFFGVAEHTQIDQVRVEWPNGNITTLENISANQVLVVTDDTVDAEVLGCTDPNSCNYDPKATVSDGSCIYASPEEITGPTSAVYFETDTYHYAVQPGESVYWEVIGGKILEESPGSITVEWGIESEGQVRITVNSPECQSSTIKVLQVNLQIPGDTTEMSIPRLWNEALLEAIRGDFARPTVHARNLFHTAIAMYDVWAVHNGTHPYLLGNEVHNFYSAFDGFTPSEEQDVSVEKAMSYAVYRLLTHRFQHSPGADRSLERFDLIMDQLGYDTGDNQLSYQSGNAAALGNFMAQTIIDYGLTDNSRELTDYDNAFYQPVNPPLKLEFSSGSPTGITNPNRWQPLTFDTFIDQSGNVIEGSTPEFLSPEWGVVYPFALSDADKEIFTRNGNSYTVYHNPETPPQLNAPDPASRTQYKWNFSLVSIWSSHLDPTDGVMWDISPNSFGNVAISSYPETYDQYPTFYNEIDGGDYGKGYPVNPATGQPYEIQMVPRGDYTRVLAEFWADGPDSETPPGHWFTLLNYVSDHELFERKFNGLGPKLSALEWDVKAYFILGGALHDAAIAAWGIKGWHDYIRPISAIRYMCELGQSTANTLPNYHPEGIELKPGFIEVVEPGDPLSGSNNENAGKIKLKAWRGHSFITNSETDVAGVGWILAENWWPYQRPSFVTPPFAGFVSGHSTFSRAAAEVMTLITGSEFFPGGMGEFIAKKDKFLVFEKGPSTDVVLQWATYRDASDQTSLSRIWGGIHPPVDDIPGRIIGEKIGVAAFDFALPYFEKTPLNTDELLVVYPNPVSSTLFVKNLKETSTMNVYSMSGQLIHQQTVSIDFPGHDMGNLSTGVYLVEVVSDTQKITKLIIKE